MKVLDGKVGIVTGAGGGIGAEYARHLASLGAHVFVADIDEAGAKAVAEEIAAAGLSTTGIAIDVTDEESIADVARTVTAHGGLDILVNNAALYKGMAMGPVEEMAPDVWRQMLDVNITGVYLVTRAFIPLLKAASGVIVNQASTGAFLAAPNAIHYNVSKAAVVAFTRCLATEVGPSGVRVNAIAPGYTLTDATRGNFSADRADASANSTALRRNGGPEDLLGVLEFLTTDASSWMTGQTVVVDGGRVFPQ